MGNVTLATYTEYKAEIIMQLPVYSTASTPAYVIFLLNVDALIIIYGLVASKTNTVAFNRM